MSGHRQAAVALHGVTDQDRELILAQLPEADQATLRHYLAELRALGFQPDAMAPALAGAPGPGAALASASPERIFAVLEPEPATLVAQVLALEDWGWSAGLLALCTPARREQIRAAGGAAPAPARASVLRAALTARLAAYPPAEAHAGVTRGPWMALRRWLGSW